jgi:hypothetical protein
MEDGVCIEEGVAHLNVVLAKVKILLCAAPQSTLITLPTYKCRAALPLS